MNNNINHNFINKNNLDESTYRRTDNQGSI